MNATFSQTAVEVKPDLQSLLPKVTVVVLHYFGDWYTRQCLSSIERLDYPNYDVLLVDNGALDGKGEEIWDEFPEIQYLNVDRPAGISGGWNAAYCYCLERGVEWVWFVSNDATVRTDTLSILMAESLRDNNIGAVGPLVYLREREKFIAYAGGTLDYRRLATVVQPLEPGSSPVQSQWLTGCAVLYKMQALASTGGFDESYFIGFEDVDLGRRLRDQGWFVMAVPSARVDHANCGTSRGVLAPLRMYYHARNRCRFFADDIRGLKRLSVPLIVGWQLIKEMHDTEEELTQRGPESLACLKGLYDFVMGRKGECTDFSPEKQSAKNLGSPTIAIPLYDSIGDTPLFDSEFYLEHNSDIVHTGLNPLDHYNQIGAVQGRRPHRLFDAEFYIRQNEDIYIAGVNPLWHYLTFGAAEDRPPNGWFSPTYYKANTCDVAGGDNPLLHYLSSGRAGKPCADFDPVFWKNWYLDDKANTMTPLEQFFHCVAQNQTNSPSISDRELARQALLENSNKSESESALKVILISARAPSQTLQSLRYLATRSTAQLAGITLLDLKPTARSRELWKTLPGVTYHESDALSETRMLLEVLEQGDFQHVIVCGSNIRAPHNYDTILLNTLRQNPQLKALRLKLKYPSGADTSDDEPVSLASVFCAARADFLIQSVREGNAMPLKTEAVCSDYAVNFDMKWFAQRSRRPPEAQAMREPR